MVRASEPAWYRPDGLPVDIEQGPCVSILMDPVIAVAQPSGRQNTKVEAVGRGDDLMVPYGRVNVEIEAGDDVVATIYKSNAHEGFLSRRKPGGFSPGYHGSYWVSIYQIVPNQFV